jgi:RHS repeat-associated protein
VTGAGIDTSYLYHPDGQRVKAATATTSNYYLFPHFEVTVVNGAGSSTKYYDFGGLRVGVRQNNGALMYLYQDHLGSVIYATHDGGTPITDQRYYSYGRKRSGGTLPTDHKFTGQKYSDNNGLYYYNARYYDPELGTFISPDTLVPDPSHVFDYNRYLYGYGNPVKFADPTGHFSEDQLTGWYGENWQDLFTDEWEQLLLDNSDSQTLGAQLGDLVFMGSNDSLVQGVLVLNEAGNLALWNVASKTATEVASIGGTTPENLGLYRILGGETGAAGVRFGYLTGGTQFLPATNGAGYGPHTMVQLPLYSPNATGLANTISLAGDWFLGQGGSRYYVHNYMAFQGFSCSSPECMGGATGTGLGTADLANTAWQGKPPTRLGLWGTGFSLAFAIYGSAMYRPVYVLQPCPNFGPNYCQAMR